MAPVEHVKIPVTLLLILLLLLPYGLSAESPNSPVTGVVLPDGTPVTVRLNQTVCSSGARNGDRLKFVVTKDVSIDGLTAIPAGSTAIGTVVKVKHRRVLGIGGNLTLALDSVELADGNTVGLNGHEEIKGRGHTKLVAAAMIATSLVFWPAAPIFLLARGGHSTALKGTEVTAHLKQDVLVQRAKMSPEDANSAMSEVMTFVPPRVLNHEGIEGDPVNLMFVGEPHDLEKAFRRAGWVQTDAWKPLMAWHLLLHRTHDATLPMARFFMFGRVQDYSYALPDPEAVVTRRHHLRIWKTDYLVHGIPVWAGSATHDIAIEIAKHGRIVNHRIDPDVDAERDFIGKSLNTTKLVHGQEYVIAANPVFNAQTTSGEAYYSDSRVLLLDFHQSGGGPTDIPGSAGPD